MRNPIELFISPPLSPPNFNPTKNRPTDDLAADQTNGRAELTVEMAELTVEIADHRFV